ncbi:MAG: hypothetical protein H6916_03555 [Novosphingobium sp.]|uniref:hypothetical protein n=1 Tax=Novosphingobium sp. TaxID=1874826 RepID=UPI00261099F1|nr:hypothetical protein [Novosphingobium sp.]MCP5385879.1 hypothetical protein [Novosphingobium sp.]
MRHPVPIAALALLLALGACKGGEKQQGAGKVEGEILPGSASDAMLPLDTVRSQPPLAPKAPAAKEGVKPGASEAAEAAAPAPEADPAPAND